MAPPTATEVTLVAVADIPAKTAPGVAKKQEEKVESSLESACYGPVKLSVPVHPSFAAHRVWALTHMTAVFRNWSRKGYTEGMSGHISVRDPEYPHMFWMNPLAIHFGLLKASDMLLLSDDPNSEEEIIYAGNAQGRPANTAGWAIHSAIHRQRPDVNAACHAHSIAGKAWSATGKRLEMIDQDVCKFYGEALAVYSDYGGVVLGEALSEGAAIARALGPRGKAAILANHGLLTVGSTVDEAGYLFGLLEKSCRIQLDLAKTGLEQRIIADREAEFNFRMESTPESLYWEFQPDLDYERIMGHDNIADLKEKDLELHL